jgi:N-carbamoyl-L-amino-acid hydrolase
VPQGGNYDGSAGVIAGIICLVRLRNEGIVPARTVKAIALRGEESAWFGRPYLGSSALFGQLTEEDLALSNQATGRVLAECMRECGADVDRIARRERLLDPRSVAAYLELHIEQGPVLLDLGLPLGAVLGTFGVERHAIMFRGQAAHSGSTPMNRRRDAFLAAARMSPEIYGIAQRHGGVCTIGSCTTKPGIVTSVVEECRITLDQRHLDPGALARMLLEAREAAGRFAAEGNVSVSWDRIWQIEPIPFDDTLVGLCEEAIRETCGRAHRLPSGPLHDAAEVSRAGVPTAMMFVQSLGGISHNKIEDTREEHLELCVRAFDRLASKAMARLVGGR